WRKSSPFASNWQSSTAQLNGLPYDFKIGCFGSPYRDSGAIGSPLCWSSNRRLSSNGLVKAFGFIGAGYRKLVARDGHDLTPKFRNLSARSRERIRSIQRAKPLWGTPRIQAELHLLGFEVA